jgi:hypothetical protein
MDTSGENFGTGNAFAEEEATMVAVFDRRNVRTRERDDGRLLATASYFIHRLLQSTEKSA